MGNGIRKLCLCSAGAGAGAGDTSKHHHKEIGNSICYVRPDTCRFSGDPFVDNDITFMTFRSVSGATVSANSSATPSTSLDDSLQHSTVLDSSASFESSASFTSTIGSFVPSPRDHLLNGGSIEKISEIQKLKRKSLNKILSRVSFFTTLSLGKNKVSNFKKNDRVSCSTCLSAELSFQGVESCDTLIGCENLHWAQGKAGEDRVHIVICEDHGWVFVGIYDGFNGPDATDYLLNNLFYSVHDELKGILCAHKFGKEDYPIGNESSNFELDCVSKSKRVTMKWGSEGDGKNVNFESDEAFRHSAILQALSEALKKTEDAFLKSSEEMMSHNPVLAMMGSCVLVMLMKGEDVYLMNVGDSRAVLATQNGSSVQLTKEHSTHVIEEVCRIRKEHPDDPFAVTKGRVKGCLSVTRAFGAGFLKQPKQNNAVLETFKVNYIGQSPYITCCPSLHHHKLCPNDKFLILSSDGLYQYFTNEEVVAKVVSFIALFPDRDPAQLLIEEALSRAAKKAGLELYELLDIPQGERRLYHDDISIVIITLEGKIWRSEV